MKKIERPKGSPRDHAVGTGQDKILTIRASPANVNYTLLQCAMLLITFYSSPSYCQLQDSSLMVNDTTYALYGNTLVSNQGYKISVGQALVIGDPQGERDWYNTISFSNGASWPLLFLKKMETDQNPEYQMDASIREKDKVKQFLMKGDTLVITKIKRFGKERFGYWYKVTMKRQMGALSINFKCDIINAIRTKEILLPVP